MALREEQGRTPPPPPPTPLLGLSKESKLSESEERSRGSPGHEFREMRGLEEGPIFLDLHTGHSTVQQVHW